MIYKNVNTVIFDVGNTLVHVDYRQIVDLAAELKISITVEQLQTAEAAGKQYVDAETRNRKHSSDKTRWNEFFKSILFEVKLSDYEVSLLLEKISVRDQVGTGLWSKLGEQSIEVLRTLQERGYKLGLVSNADGRIKQLLREVGLFDFFPDILDSSEVGIEKPDPAIFLRALDGLNSTPEEAVYVGDLYEVDAKGAIAAEIKPILLDPHGIYADKGILTFSSLIEILPLFEDVR